MTVLISLVITVYNRQQLLPATIESVLAQTYPDFELLIWDDGSTDESVRIAQRYAQQDPRIRVVAAPHQGIAPSRASATAQTRGEYFGWVDSDDLLAPTALAATCAVLDTQPNVGMVYSDYQVIDAQGQNHGMGQRCALPYSPLRLLVELITFHFRLIRRSVYDQVGGVDPTYEWSEDYDLCLKISEVTQIHYLPQPLYFYRRHASNITNNQAETIRWSARAVQSALKRQGLDKTYELNVRSQFSLTRKLNSTEDPTTDLSDASYQFDTAPFVSILIPSYNVEARIAACLQSCFQQTYPNLEIVVVDNGSTDRTVEVIKVWAARSPHPFQLLHCSEPGANPTRNLAFLHAKGNYIQWLDADDELDPNKIAAQVQSLEQHPDYSVAYGSWHWHFYDQAQRINQLSFLGQPHDDMLFQLLMDNWRPPHTYLLRRTAAAELHQLQAWHPQTRVCMDREYFTLAAALGHKFLYVPAAESHYVSWSINQVSRSIPYLERVQSLSRISQRCWDVAQLSQGRQLQRAHLFLLRQDWNLWLPAFRLMEQEGRWMLHHLQTEAQQTLTPIEALISCALLYLPESRTLAHHSAWIVRQLLQVLLAEYPNPENLAPLSHNAPISQALAQLVGLPGTLPRPLDFDKLLQCLFSTETFSQLQSPLLQQFPLFAPLFGEQRLAVQGVLERLRLQGWLKKTLAIY